MCFLNVVLVEMKKKVDLKKKGKVTVLSGVMLFNDVEEGDSGIDANSQGSCSSSTDVKNAAAAARVTTQSQNSTSNKKEKKKKGKESSTDVKTNSSTNAKLTTNSAATQTTAAKLNSPLTKSNKVSY